VDAPVGETRKDDVEFAEPYERFAADEGHVHGTMPIDEGQDAVDERLALEITDIAERDAAPA
jgi:hypothetical protein